MIKTNKEFLVKQSVGGKVHSPIIASKMIKTNKEFLVKQSVGGKVHSPIIASPYRISRDGMPMILPATGGISYNVKVGDSCMKWVGDHVEPGVSVRNENTNENNALMVLG